MADIDVTQVLKLLENEEERIVGEITKIETRGPLLDDGEKIGLQAYKNHLAMIGGNAGLDAMGAVRSVAPPSVRNDWHSCRMQPCALNVLPRRRLLGNSACRRT
jgi:hypothetical protein